MLIDCGMRIYKAFTSPADKDHDALVAELNAEETESLSVTTEPRPTETVDWDGAQVSLTHTDWKPEPGTIHQPSVFMVASHVVDGERLTFTCWVSLSLLPTMDAAQQRIDGCRDGLRQLSVASR